MNDLTLEAKVKRAIKELFDAKIVHTSDRPPEAMRCGVTKSGKLSDDGPEVPRQGRLAKLLESALLKIVIDSMEEVIDTIGPILVQKLSRPKGINNNCWELSITLFSGEDFE